MTMRHDPKTTTAAPLVDSFGRLHTSLRISVTDRCNIRCFYCMPEHNVQFMPRDEILSFEEITRLTRIFAGMGVNKLRITGGEPLVRAELPKLIGMLSTLQGIDDVAMTTNGMLLADQVQALKDAGLRRLNISLDGLSEETFRRIARRDGLPQVLDGIFAAQHAGFTNIRLNAVAIRGITEAEVIPLAEFARTHGLEMRFIEYMPLDAENHWQADEVLSGQDIRDLIQAQFGPLIPVGRDEPSQPATNFRFADGPGRIGFINPVSEPFCHNCNRLRVTAEGKLRNCLFSTVEWDARQLMRSGESDDAIAKLIRECVAAKKPGHGIDRPDFVKPQRAMYQIGG